MKVEENVYLGKFQYEDQTIVKPIDIDNVTETSKENDSTRFYFDENY